MRKIIPLVIYLLSLGLVQAHDVSVVVKVVPPVITFANTFPIGATVMGLLVPIVFIGYTTKFLEFELSPKTTFKFIFFCVSLVLSTILLSYLLYYLTLPA